MERSPRSQLQVVGCSEGKHLPLILLHLLEVSSGLNQLLEVAFLALLQQLQHLLREVDYLAEELLLLLLKERDCSEEPFSKEPLSMEALNRL